MLYLLIALVFLLGLAVGYIARYATAGDALARDLRRRAAATRATLDRSTRARLRRDAADRATTPNRRRPGGAS